MVDDIDDEYSGWNIYEDKRSSPKKGRRAPSDLNHVASSTQAELNRNVESLDSPFKGLDIKGFVNDSPPPKPPRTSTGGWADNSTRFNKSNDAEDTARKLSIYDEDENEVVTTIPDLDDFREEDFVAQVAKAPNVSVNRVATYKELDSDLHKHSAFVTLNDIDLKALTRFMSLETDVKEDDYPWTWDSLLTEVASKLNLEQSLEGEAN